MVQAGVYRALIEEFHQSVVGVEKKQAEAATEPRVRAALPALPYLERAAVEFFSGALLSQGLER